MEKTATVIRSRLMKPNHLVDGSESEVGLGVSAGLIFTIFYKILVKGACFLVDRDSIANGAK